MENDLREINIEKNREFNDKTHIIRLVFFIATILSFVGGAISKNELAQSLFVITSVLGMINLGWWSSFGSKCPKCAAMKYKEELSKDMVSESLIGTRQDRDTFRTVSRTISQTYLHRNICKYCGYEWTKTSVERKEESV